MNIDTLERQYENQTLDRHLSQIDAIGWAMEKIEAAFVQTCDNCRKRWEPSCDVYKESGKKRRPPDNSWCVGWRRKG